MNLSIGTIITALITDENEEAYFAQKSGVTYRILKEETSDKEYQIGEGIEGFAYSGQKGELRLTTKIPVVQKGKEGMGSVTDVRRDLGVFVDIGLTDKDIVVSLDDLPQMKELWPKKGDTLFLSIRTDDKDRMWGQLAEDAYFLAMGRKGTQEMHNKEVNGVVYRLKLVGSYVLTDDHYLGYIHPDERFQEPRLGENIKARVIGIGKDGSLNLSLKPRAHEVIESDAQMILAILERSPERRIPFTDKSAPEEIKKQFGISKGQFKRALGNLMKARLIEQKDGHTILKKNNEN